MKGTCLILILVLGPTTVLASLGGPEQGHGPKLYYWHAAPEYPIESPATGDYRYGRQRCLCYENGRPGWFEPYIGQENHSYGPNPGRGPRLYYWHAAPESPVHLSGRRSYHRPYPEYRNERGGCMCYRNGKPGWFRPYNGQGRQCS